MTSLIAGLILPASQRRMREIVNLFNERETRDEFGAGQVRDALSDAYGPDLSTVHLGALLPLDKAAAMADRTNDV